MPDLPLAADPDPVQPVIQDAGAEQAASADGAYLDHAMRVLAEALDHGQPPPLNAGADALLTACRALLAPFGMRLAGIRAKGGAQDLVGLDELGEQHNFAWRSVHLPAHWYRQDLGALLAFRDADAAPVALIRQKWGYSLFNPVTGQSHPVTPALAAGLKPQAAMLYPRLPPGKAGLKDIYRLGFGPNRGDRRLLILVALVLGLLSLAGPVATGLLFGDVVPNSDRGSLLVIMAGLVAITLGRSLYQLVAQFALLRLESRIELVLQGALWDRLLRLPLGFFHGFQIGDLMRRAEGFMEMRQVLSAGMLETVLAVVTAGFSALAMLWYGGMIGLACLMLVLLFYAVPILLDLSMVRLRERQINAQALLGGFVIQLIRMIGKIKVNAAETRAYATWVERFAPIINVTRRIELRGAFAALIIGELPILLSFCTIALVANARDPIEIGGFIAFSLALGEFIGGFGTLALRLSTILTLAQHYARLRPILRATPEDDGLLHAPGPLTGLIEFNHVVFGYDRGAPPLLDQISFTVNPGELVAIVGPSGAGKSTVIRLLLGFEQPWSGTVFLDGQDLSGLNLVRVRQQFGVVLQRGGLVGGSIFQNIASGLPISPEAAFEAARLAGFDEDIRAMPMGLHTLIRDEAMLSGGQRQRLMLARALVRRPRILLLDEATSALDNRTQETVARNMAGLQMSRLVIAHRLSTVQAADRILVMDAGRIVETGTFQQLIDRGQLFAQLAQRQLC